MMCGPRPGGSTNHDIEVLMRRTARAGAVVCSVLSMLAACSGDAPTSAVSPGDDVAPNLATGGNGNACGQPTRPGNIVEKVTTPPAWGAAVRDDGLTYFSELFSGGLGITSTRTRTLDGFVATGDVPTGLAFAPDGNTVYVANQGSNNVGVVDVATNVQVATISTEFASPFTVRVSPDGERLFIATNTTTVFIVNTATREIIGTIQVGDAPNGFAVHPDGRILYVSAFVGGTVTEIDMFTGIVLRTFAVGGVPQDMALDRKGRRLFVANEAGYINEVNLETGEQGPTIPLAGGGFGIGVTPDDGQAYVSIPFSGLVQVFSLQSRQLVKSINVGGEPRRIGFSQRGNIGAIANMGGFVTFVR